MSTIDTTIAKARQEFLLALDETQVSGEFLRQFLAQAENATPKLLDSYAADEMLAEIDPVQFKWDVGYYSRQKRCAKQNFSKERLEHLIAVREYFRQEGYKGFVPPSVSSAASGVSEGPQATRFEDTPSSYQPSSNLKKFVDEGDLLTVQTALRLELNNNRLSRQDLQNASAWTKGQAPNLFEPYAEKAFARAIDPDQSQWLPAYYDNQTVYLKTNFSEKRFLHLVEVREHLRQLGVEGFAPIATPSTPSPQPAPRPRAVLPTANQPPSTPSPESNTARPELNPIFKIALLFGGALAAVVIYLSLVK
ncbi:hypothetical protein [Paraburkholderia domus]|jgi:hypothetical protein|uniref:hypothetical protein n=1 Tax=Paraburkholderia TaxID=1822464 RepID=UPI0019120F19|nr:hypothetical protein [Paraburkholderia domus]CAE6824592.1 hypothetical protein R75483_06406 [Paraburkholderia domus]CAE6961200.1 hypothetical protein R70199_07336 [Paraburkholderia domus]